jgi:hypothetical protein
LLVFRASSKTRKLQNETDVKGVMDELKKAAKE